MKALCVLLFLIYPTVSITDNGFLTETSLLVTPEPIWSSFFSSVNITFVFCFPLCLKKKKNPSIQQRKAYTTLIFYLDSLSVMNSQFLAWTKRSPILNGSRWLFPHQLMSSETCLCLISKKHSQIDHRVFHGSLK